MTVSASDLISEVKLDEKREVHIRKMLGFRVVDPCISNQRVL